MLACAALLTLLPSILAEGASASSGGVRRILVGFSNLTEEPGVSLEGTGFTGADIHESVFLSARTRPVDVVYYVNGLDGSRTLSNVEDALRRKVDCYILYSNDDDANRAAVRRLQAAGVPVLAVNHAVPGVPLYGSDDEAAGRLAGEALGRFARESWAGQPVGLVLAGPSGAVPGLTRRVDGVLAGLRERFALVRIERIDTVNPAAELPSLLGAYLSAHPNEKVLVAALNDATALAAKGAIEAAGRIADAAIVSHGADRSIHGGANDKKELDPHNRGSILLGSVAYWLDRYGEDLLPLCMRLAGGERLPERIPVRHQLITHANVWAVYPPQDMN